MPRQSRGSGACRPRFERTTRPKRRIAADYEATAEERAQSAANEWSQGAIVSHQPVQYFGDGTPAPPIRRRFRPSLGSGQYRSTEVRESESRAAPDSLGIKGLAALFWPPVEQCVKRHIEQDGYGWCIARMTANSAVSSSPSLATSMICLQISWGVRSAVIANLASCVMASSTLHVRSLSAPSV